MYRINWYMDFFDIYCYTGSISCGGGDRFEYLD